MPVTRRLIPVLAALGLTVAAPAAAHAEGDPIYDIVLEADVEQTFDIPDVHVDGGLHVSGSLGQVVLHRTGEILRDTHYIEGTQSAHGTATFATSKSGPCQLTANSRGLGMALRPSPAQPLNGDLALEVRFGENLEYELIPRGEDCPPTMLSGYLATEELGEGPMDAVFELPREVVGRGKTIQIVDGPTRAACPPPIAGASSCSNLQWHGEVTFTRVGTTADGQQVTPDPVVPPPPIDPNVPPPLVPPAHAPDELDDLLAPLVPSGSATISRTSGSLRFRATCPAGCVGTATLRPASTRATPRAAGTSSSAVRLQVRAPGRPGSQTIRLTVPKRSRSTVRRIRKGQAQLELHALAGGPTTVRTLPLRRQR